MKKFLISTCVAAAAASSTSADNITMTLDSMPAYEAYSVAVNMRLTWNNSDPVSFTSTSVLAGEREWTNQYGREVTTYCIQLFQGASIGETYTYSQTTDLNTVPGEETAPGPMSEVKVGMVEDLYARFMDLRTGKLADTALTSDYDYATASAAFQLVLWEISHEDLTGTTLDEARDQLSMDMGAFRAAEASSATQLIISALGQDGWESTDNLVGLHSDTAQDQLMVVPLPAPVVLAGIGLIGVAAVRRKRTR